MLKSATVCNKFTAFELCNQLILQKIAFMKSKLLFLLCLTASITTFAQYSDEEAEVPATMNIVKLNAPDMLIRNFTFQYERVISKNISVAVAFRGMPNGKIPLSGAALNAVGLGFASGFTPLSKIKVNGLAITPEVRFYVGKKGYGQGFYFAPFYRYSQAQLKEISIDYDLTPNSEKLIKLNGKSTVNMGGLMIGAQWFFGERISLDWWIAGLQFGANKGSFSGFTSVPLTTDDQARVLSEINNVDIPFVKKTVTVNANNATVSIKGPWLGVRAGLAIGIRF
jgi:hypothetical protein